MVGRLRRSVPSTAVTQYDAFISYSHADDGRLAPALQAGLQRLAKPWYRPRALRVFRDETGLAVNPHLWSSITAAMESARYFILLCSPDAAASPWVNREIDHWVAHHPAEHILPVLTEGTLEWAPARDDYDPERSTALPPSLHGRFADEPRHLDLRWAREEEQLDLRHSRFRGAVADLAAPLHGMAKDELEGEDVRQHHRARRLARGAVAGLAVLLVASLIAGGLAVANAGRADRNAQRAERQSERAEREAVVARARGLAGQAAARASSAPDLALLLALEADRLNESVESRSALLTTLEQTTRLREIVTGFPAAETVVGLSDDGGTLALSDPGGRVRLLDVDTRDPLAAFDTGQRGPVDVFFSSDGTVVATTSEDTTVRLWDAESGRARSPVLREHGYPIRTADFSADGQLLATADGSGQGLLWDGAGRLLSRLPDTFALYVAGIEFSPDASRVAISGALGTQVFRMADGGRTVSTEFGLEGASGAVAFSADGALLATARADDRLVDVWDVASRQRRHSFRFPGATDFSALSFSRDRGTLVAGNTDGTTIVWDLETGQAVGQPLAGLRGAVEHVTIDAGASHITTASAAGVASWDLQGTALSTHRSLGPFPSGFLVSQSVAFSPDGHHIVTMGADGQLSIWDGATLERRGEFVPTGSSHCCSYAAASSPDGPSVVAGAGAYLSSIDVQAGAVDRPPLDLGEPMADLDFSRDGKLLAVGTNEGTAAIVDVERWSVRRRVTVPLDGAVEEADFGGLEVGVALSPDGTLLATVGNEGRVLLEDVRGGGRTTLAESKGPAFSVDFSADGRYLAAGFANGTALLIDVQRRQSAPVALVGHAGLVLDVAFSPDDDLLAVASHSGVTLWDVDTRQRIGVLEGRALPFKLAFSPDGTLATAWHDHSLTVFELDQREWRRRACEIAGRNLTRTEWDQYVGDEPYRRTCRQWPEG